MNNKYIKFIIKHILVVIVSYVLIGCSELELDKITSPSTTKNAPLVNITNQQPHATIGSYTFAVTCNDPAKLTLDNAGTEVTQYLHSLQSIHSDYRAQHQEQYQPTGKRLLQQVEELKKSQKIAYRMADRNFRYNTDVSPEGMYLLYQEMKNHKEQLRSLRDLRGRLLQTFHFSQEELLACHVRIKPSQGLTDDYAIDSSDEEKLTYSRGELALRKGGLQGIQQGILGFPRHFLESLQSMLLDKESTIDKLTDYLIETPDVSDQLAEYMDSIEGNEEEKGKEIGEWITSQLLVGISEIYQANFIKYIGKVKLIKALLKVVRAKHQQVTKTHKLTQKGLKQIEKLVTYKDQSAQEVLQRCGTNLPTPPVKHKSYWNKSLSELANLAAKGDADAKTIVEFLQKELQNI
jgi:hypothetical protein